MTVGQPTQPDSIDKIPRVARLKYSSRYY